MRLEETPEGIATEWFYDCPQCGEIGRLSELRDHPTRPMPLDVGFCPHCGSEVDGPITKAHVRGLLIEYGDDPDAWFASLAPQVSA